MTANEGGEEAAFAEQGVCDLRATICMAKKVGAGLGVGKILQ